MVWIQAAIALLLVAVDRYFLPESVLRLLDDTILLDLIAVLGVLVAPPLVTLLTLVSRLPPRSKICQLLATWLLAMAAMAAFGAPLAFDATTRWMRAVERAAPLGPFMPLPARLWDQTPIRVMTTAAWQKIPTTATVDRVRSDPSLWRRMFVDDFDRLPEPLRTESLSAMWQRYGHLVHAPSTSTGDGLVTGLVMAHLVASGGRPLSERLAGFRRFPQVLRNVRVREKRGAKRR